MIASVKTKMFVYGVPTFEASIAVIGVVLLNLYVAPYGLLYVLFAGILIYFYKRFYLADYKLILPFDSNQLGNFSFIGIKGLNESDIAQISRLINNNELISIILPKISTGERRVLKKVLGDFIYRKSGFSEFHDGDEFKIEGKPLGKRAVILSYRNKSDLQESISILMQRGWAIQGDQGVESNLIDRIYTQTMVYEG